ncbi:hypothetical protein vBValSX1_141 [Vibrio phage vB_ValS_X1]|uniref:Uncharacterized protein n=1 Tax=Vibrio phage vB_ValS_X1 TaxID=2736341 RepID=A0A6M9Z9N6_9CAUD|nr:hypothetical protein vBValSX1_141 [Vibrio phage vB_ValS_X1]
MYTYNAIVDDPTHRWYGMLVKVEVTDLDSMVHKCIREGRQSYVDCKHLKKRSAVNNHVVGEPRCGILFNKGAIWLGGHYSPYNRRWCINLVPCITIWFTLRDGKAPQRAKF